VSSRRNTVTLRTDDLSAEWRRFGWALLFFTVCGVNIAARVANVAGAGEVLLTEATRDALGTSVGVRSRGSRAFKNVTQQVALFELAVGTEKSPRALPIDPVCHMAIDPALAAGRQVHRGVEHHFCSERCAGLFARAPGHYTRRQSTREHVLRWLTRLVRRGPKRP